MTKRGNNFVAILFVLAFSCDHSAFGQDGPTENGSQLLFGDLSRPADVLLAEAEARVAKSALGRRLTVYMELQGQLTERRAFDIGELDGGPTFGTDKTQLAAELKDLERALQQTESDIRALSAKLSSNWLPPVHTSIDDQQGARILQNANVSVTLKAESGDILEPARLTLTAPGVSSVGFAQITSGVYLAGDVPPGEYQLLWQLTLNSIVQRASKITIGEKGCVACEVVLGMPEPKITTKVVDAIVFPHRSISVPLYGNETRPGDDSNRESQTPHLIEGLEAPTP